MPGTRQHEHLNQVQREVIKELRQLYRHGEPLNISAVQRRHPELLRKAYAVQPFWGWKRALEDAGIDYRDIKVELTEEIRCELCGQWYSKLPLHLNRVHGCNAEEYKMDFPGAPVLSERQRARLTFRSYLKEHGEAPRVMPHWEPLWSAEYVLDRLAEFHRRGIDLSCSAISDRELALMDQTIGYFGSWDEALRRAGLSPNLIRREVPPGYWTTDTVTRALLDRKKKRLPVTISRLPAGLQRAIRMVFAKSELAFEAAGFNETVYRPHLIPRPPKEKVAAFLREVRRIARLPDYRQKRAAKRRLRTQYKAVIRRTFKLSWKAISRAAGVQPGRILMQRRAYQTKDNVVRRIKWRHQRGWPVNSAGVQKGPHCEPVLNWKARALFGSWDKALRAAGLDPTKIRMSRPSPYTSRKKVIDAIRARARRNIPLNCHALQTESDRSQQLLSSAQRLFKGWGRAVRAAGIDYRKVHRNLPRYTTASAVLREIRRRAKAGLPLTCLSVKSTVQPDAALEHSAHTHFGSWPAAVRAAGLDYSKFVGKRPGKYTSPEKVLRAIQARHAQGLPLRGIVMQTGPVADASLMQYAQRFFGTWRDALRSAGLNFEAIPSYARWIESRPSSAQN